MGISELGTEARLSEEHMIPPGWVSTTLEGIASICDELRQPVNADERAKRVGPYPYYGATGQVGWIDDYRMDGEYILLGEDGAPFLDPTKPKAYLVSGKCWVNNHAHVLLAVPGVTDNRYLLYALNAASYHNVVNGTTRLKLTQGAMRLLSINLAPLAEQRRIVAAIETQFTRLDASVASLKSAKARLKRYRAAVLKAAVEGELTAKWRTQHPDTESASALLQRILQERRAAWEQAELEKFAKAGKTPPKGWQVKYQEPTEPDTSGLPELPEGWSWVTVDILLVEPACNGISVKGTDTPPGIPALRLSAMTNRGFDFQQRRYIPITEAVAGDLAIRAGDFFVARGNGSLHLVGRGTLAQVPPDRVVFPDTMIRLRFASIGALRMFINLIWSSGLMRRQVETTARTTAGIYKISQRDIGSFILPLPPFREQQQIVAEVERRLSVLSHLEAEVEAGLKRAERLRQSILQQAFSGKLVPQDPADEPASMLLDRIRATKDETGRTASARTRQMP